MWCDLCIIDMNNHLREYLRSTKHVHGQEHSLVFSPFTNNDNEDPRLIRQWDSINDARWEDWISENEFAE